MQIVNVAKSVQRSQSISPSVRRVFKAEHKLLKTNFIGLLRDCGISTDDFDKLMNWLESTSFFIDPASAKYHNAFYGGLLDHSLNVLSLLKNDIVTYSFDDIVSIRNITIAALLHDVCKIGNYNITQAWRKNDFGKWESYPGYGYNPDYFPAGHGEKSVMMLMQVIQLEPIEMLAIRWHGGAFEDGKKIDFINAAKDRPLVSMLHTADLNASLLFETQGTIEWLVNL